MACQVVALALILHRAGWDWQTLKAAGRKLFRGEDGLHCGLVESREVIIVSRRVVTADAEVAPAAGGFWTHRPASHARTRHSRVARF